MKKYYKQVCIKIATDTQYDSVKAVLQKFVEIGISFDIYIPRHKENARNVNSMFDRTCDIVLRDGFKNIKRKISKRKIYHLALITPNFEESINAKYYVKYSYGPAHTVKPIITHRADRLNRYHGYILHSKRDLDIFSVFSKTHLLPDLKYIGYQRANSNTVKKTLLFLPSWEGQDSLGWIADSAKKLKENYNIIVKLHPYGDFGAKIPDTVKNVKKEIRKVADEYYDGEASLKDLLGRCDLVISDISGAVFDALYVGVPVTMYSKNINAFDLPGIKSACAQYVEDGFISLSRRASSLVLEVPNALTERYALRQRVLSAKVFNQDFTLKAVEKWMNVINLYLKDEINQEYIAMHNLMSREFWQYKNEVDRLMVDTKKLIDQNSVLASEIKAHSSVRHSARVLKDNIKRKIKTAVKRNKID